MDKDGQCTFPEWEPWSSPLDYLAEIYRNVCSEEIEASECKQILREVEASITDSLIDCRELLDFRNWNLAKLQERDHHIAAPRISLLVDQTARGNLTLRWYPTVKLLIGFEEEKNDTDFNSYIHRMKDQHFPDRRPINELMFVHDVWRLRVHGKESLPYLKHCLLLAIAASVHHWQTQLSYYCEVELLTDFEFQIENQKIFTWSIYNVEEKKKENEQKWIANFEVEWGISPVRFAGFYEQASAWDKCAEMNKSLKKNGFSFPLKKVREAIQRMQAYHAHLFKKELPKI